MNINATIFFSSQAINRRIERSPSPRFRLFTACLSLGVAFLLAGCEHTETVSYPGSGLEFTVENTEE